MSHQHIEAQVPAEPPPVWQRSIPQCPFALKVDNIRSMSASNLLLPKWFQVVRYQRHKVSYQNFYSWQI